MKKETRRLRAAGREVKAVILRPEDDARPLPGILWIHGGGYMLGMASMVRSSCGKVLAERFGGVVVSPGYRLAWQAPYPAALEDCYTALLWMWENAEELGIARDRIVAGGESAGGGLAAALCMYARDMGEVKIAVQVPLYPMLDCRDTESSRDNHGRVWNTRRNHWGWSHYLGELYGTENVPVYASPAGATDYGGLPPCCTFVCDGEPFYSETLTYAENLRKAGVRAYADVYHGNIHAFDKLCPWLSMGKEARLKLCMRYAELMGIDEITSDK